MACKDSTVSHDCNHLPHSIRIRYTRIIAPRKAVEERIRKYLLGPRTQRMHHQIAGILKSVLPRFSDQKKNYIACDRGNVMLKTWENTRNWNNKMKWMGNRRILGCLGNVFTRSRSPSHSVKLSFRLRLLPGWRLNLNSWSLSIFGWLIPFPYGALVIFSSSSQSSKGILNDLLYCEALRCSAQTLSRAQIFFFAALGTVMPWDSHISLAGADAVLVNSFFL